MNKLGLLLFALVCVNALLPVAQARYGGASSSVTQNINMLLNNYDNQLFQVGVQISNFNYTNNQSLWASVANASSTLTQISQNLATVNATIAASSSNGSISASQARAFYQDVQILQSQLNSYQHDLADIQSGLAAIIQQLISNQQEIEQIRGQIYNVTAANEAQTVTQIQNEQQQLNSSDQSLVAKLKQYNSSLARSANRSLNSQLNTLSTYPQNIADLPKLVSAIQQLVASRAQIRQINQQLTNLSNINASSAQGQSLIQLIQQEIQSLNASDNSALAVFSQAQAPNSSLAQQVKSSLQRQIRQLQGDSVQALIAPLVQEYNDLEAQVRSSRQRPSSAVQSELNSLYKQILADERQYLSSNQQQGNGQWSN